MTAIWPAGVDDTLLYGSYNEKRRPHKDEDMTESGKMVTSKKPGTPLTDIVGSIYVTIAQRDELDAFHNVTCAEGTLPFQWRDPHSRSLKVFHWVDTPAYSEHGLDGYMVKLALARE